MNSSKYTQGVITVLRVIIALVFIFSGFVKGVDPWGTAIKLGEYFSAFGLTLLSGSEMFFAVVLIAVEMVLGLVMLFNIGKRTTYLLMLIIISFFTLLTLVLALTDPVSDCGCFGDAVKLTNWQTFYKNAVLWVFALLVWKFGFKTSNRDNDSKILDMSMILVFILFGVGISVYSMRYLPVIDFLPFKEGAHIPSLMNPQGGNDVSTILLYKDKLNGQEHEFTLTDTTWYDTVRWEFVDTRFVTDNSEESVTAPVEFSIFNDDGDHAHDLLSYSGATFIITVTDIADISDKCMSRLNEVVNYAYKYNIDVIGVTTSAIMTSSSLPIGGRKVPLYNIDATTLKTFIRARTGVVLIKEGTILAKWSCRGLPDFETLSDSGNVLSVVTGISAKSNMRWLAGTLLAAFVLIYLGYFTAHRHR